MRRPRHHTPLAFSYGAIRTGRPSTGPSSRKWTFHSVHAHANTTAICQGFVVIIVANPYPSPGPAWAVGEVNSPTQTPVSAQHSPQPTRVPRYSRSLSAAATKAIRYAETSRPRVERYAASAFE